MEDKEKMTPEAEVAEQVVAATPAEEKAEEQAAPETQKEAKPKKKKGGLIAAIAVIALVIVAVGAFCGFAFLSNSQAIAAYHAKDFATAYNKIGSAFFMTENDKNIITEKYVLEVLCKEGKYYEGRKILEASTIAEERLQKIYAQDPEFAFYKIGQIVKFGKYETDGDMTNGAEELQWVVLDVIEEDGVLKAVLMTKKIVGTCENWNRLTPNNTFYAKSEVNDWCNVEFYNTFTMADFNLKSKILKTVVSTEDSSGGVDSGEDVEAFAYAPSTQQIENALKGELAKYKQASVTPAAAKAGVTGYGKNAYGAYYVRNIGNNVDGTQYAAGYDKEGAFQELISMQSPATGLRVCITVEVCKLPAQG